MHTEIHHSFLGVKCHEFLLIGKGVTLCLIAGLVPIEVVTTS
jgi:hypothetical protein